MNSFCCIKTSISRHNLLTNSVRKGKFSHFPQYTLIELSFKMISVFIVSENSVIRIMEPFFYFYKRQPEKKNIDIIKLISEMIKVMETERQTKKILSEISEHEYFKNPPNLNT